MGRESSVKAQVEEVQRHFPATGSQKGVEQLVGTTWWSAWHGWNERKGVYAGNGLVGHRGFVAPGWDCLQSARFQGSHTSQSSSVRDAG
jgi:hypothetical protein